MIKRFLLSVVCLMVLTVHAQTESQYVDLGLPSGTFWKQSKETGTYTYDDAVRYFDGFLPTSGQFKELIDNCKWEWTGRGYKVIGKNGRSIFILSEFKRGKKVVGAYWSITKDDNGCCFGLLCYPSRVKIDRSCDLNNGRNIILCK